MDSMAAAAKWRLVLTVLVSLCVFGVFAGCKKPTQPNPENDFVIFTGHLLNGFDLGVESSAKRRDWVSVADGELRIAYPSDEAWGTAFIVVGLVMDPPRPSLDFSGFKKISLELRGISDQSAVDIGIKDRDDPDNGLEDKVHLGLSREWDTYEINLQQFETADLRILYVVAEFVFRGPAAEVVYCRDIRYLP